MWTKRQLIEQAYAEIGLASYVYDIDDSDLQSALMRLDSMIATWNGNGINISYLLPANPDESFLTQESGLPDWAHECVFMNLAIRLAPSLGKQVLPETKALAVRAYAAMVNKLNEETNLRPIPSTMPIGAGYKYGKLSPFIAPQEDVLSIGGEGNLVL